MEHCLKKYSKISVLLIILVIFSFSSSLSRVSADSIYSTESRYVGTKNIVKPDALMLVKISPKINDNLKFFKSLDMLFIDNLNLHQNIFSYVALGDRIYRLKGLDENYSTNDNDGKVVYVAYTDQLPLQLIANLKEIHKIKKISYAKLTFQKNNFNINEAAPLVENLPQPKIDYQITEASALYNNTPEPGGISDIKVKFKNVSAYPIFKTDPSNIIVISQNNDKETSSSMFINNVWYSKTRVGEVIEDRVGINDYGNVTFQTQVNVEAGKQTEKFALATPDGKIFPGTAFEISFDVPNKGQKIVQVLNNSYGFTNVRDKTTGGSKVIGFVNQGTKLLVLEEQGSWIKIRFEGTKDGWIPSGALKKLY